MDVQMNPPLPAGRQTPTQPVQPSPTSIPVDTPAKTGGLLNILLILVAIASLGAAGFFGYQNYQIKQELASKPAPTETLQQRCPAPQKPTPTPASEWKEAKFGGVFSYEYPQNWHVAELWPQTAGQGITLAIDPNPINTAGRGGPLATFEIRILNGLPNPNEVFEQEKAKFNEESYTDITSETINSPLGPVYYYKGKFAPGMFEGQPIETYYLTFQGTLNDPPNQQIIIASMALKDDPKLSEMLRHVVLSIKKS